MGGPDESQPHKAAAAGVRAATEAAAALRAAASTEDARVAAAAATGIAGGRFRLESQKARC